MQLSDLGQKPCLIFIASLGVSLAATIFSSSPSIAQTPNCENPQTTLEMRVCADRAYKSADKKLNQVYQNLRPKLARKQQQRLLKAQLAWIQFRDRTCEYEAGNVEGGTLEPVIKLSCLADVTSKRVQDLEGYLQEIDLR